MCGIVAVFGRINHTMRNVFRELFIVDQVRGMDSCGVAGLHNHGVTIVKDIYDPVTIMQSKRYDKLENRGDLYGLIGHNRWRTKGEITAENAHPFNHGSVTGVHNGTINYTGDLPDSKDFEVDSDNLIYAINKVGIDKAWQGLGYTGAAAVVYHDSKTKSLNLITNGKRPLNFAYSEDGNTIFIASESWMIRAICNRNQTGLKKSTNGGDVYIPENNVLHSFTLDKKGALHLKLHKIPDKQIIGLRRNGEEDYGQYLDDGWWDRRQAAIDAFRVAEKKPEPQHTGLPDASKKHIAEEEFKRRYPFCGGCGKDMCDEFKDSVILDAKTAICGECGEVATEKKPDIKDAKFSTGNSLIH